MRAHEDTAGTGHRACWPRALEAAAQMRRPLALIILYYACKFAEISRLIPARWDRFDSLVATPLLVGAFLLLILRVATLAEHATVMERQRQDRVTRGSAESLPGVRGLQGRVEMCEIKLDVLADTVADMCDEAGVPEVADKVALRIVSGQSGRPVA